MPGSVTVDAKAQKTNGSMRMIDGSMKAKAVKDGSMKAKAEKTAVDGGSMPTVDAKAEKANGGSMRVVDGSMKTKAEKERDGSMKTKAEKTTNAGSMRTVDAKAQKLEGSMRTIVDGSMAKAEKGDGKGGSMRLVETKARKETPHTAARRLLDKVHGEVLSSCKAVMTLQKKKQIMKNEQEK
eukprot:scaffold31613_cov59-Cyclotella_meneghiniana.AAC.3